MIIQHRMRADFVKFLNLQFLDNPNRFPDEESHDYYLCQVFHGKQAGEESATSGVPTNWKPVWCISGFCP